MAMMIVSKIDKQQDRTIIYGNDKNYHVIASDNIDIQIGDEIEYEPYGMNFGWYVKTISTVQLRNLKEKINMPPPTLDEINKNQFIIAHGNILDGFDFVGPFDTRKQATLYSKQIKSSSDNCNIIKLTKPGDE